MARLDGARQEWADNREVQAQATRDADARVAKLNQEEACGEGSR